MQPKLISKQNPPVSSGTNYAFTMDVKYISLAIKLHRQYFCALNFDFFSTS